MKIMITGAAGQLGADLLRVLRPRHEVAALSRRDLDVTDRGRVLAAAERVRPDAIIHSAAYTNVDGAERERDLAYAVNAAGTRHVAEAAGRTGAALVYVSTDYVFDGRKGAPYTEADEPRPINRYGETKLAGERLVRDLHANHFIVRTSWLYGGAGRNFVETILAAAGRQPLIYAAEDAVGSPTYAPDLARFIDRLLGCGEYGLYHAAVQGCCSRYEFARAIVEGAGGDPGRVVPVSSDHFALPAPRPLNSALASEALGRCRLAPLRDWREALRDYLAVRAAGKENRTDTKEV